MIGMTSLLELKRIINSFQNFLKVKDPLKNNKMTGMINLWVEKNSNSSYKNFLKILKRALEKNQ